MNRLLYDLSLAELTTYVSQLGEPSYRAKQIYGNIGNSVFVENMSNLSKGLRERLSADFLAPPQITEALFSKDGSAKYLYCLYDDNLVEGVFMPHDYGNTLCVSTQAGCRMGCAFCASGIGGLARNLSSGEILGQIVAVNNLLKEENRSINNVVLMGSGEPLDNYDNVISFLKAVSDPDGLHIGRRNISLSTCGLTDKIRALADTDPGVTLSISLHATTDDTRRRIMPIANTYSIAEIVSAARYYFQKTGRRIIYEYALIKDLNMNYFDAKRLREITKEYPAHVNLIPLNPVKEKALQGCTKREAEIFLQKLKGLGVSATIRRSMGTDISGACGQLRRKKLENN